MQEDQKGLQQLTIGSPISEEESPQRSTCEERSTSEYSIPPEVNLWKLNIWEVNPTCENSAPSLKSQPHNWEVSSPTPAQKWPIPSRRRKRDSKRSHLWDQASGQQWSKSSRRRRGGMCSHWWSPKPWEEFSSSRDSCQTPFNSPPLRRLKFLESHTMTTTFIHTLNLRDKKSPFLNKFLAICDRGEISRATLNCLLTSMLDFVC